MNDYDILYKKIILEQLNEKDQNIIDNMINILNNIKQNKDITYIHPKLSKEIFDRLRNIINFGKIDLANNVKKVKKYINSELLNSLRRNKIKLTDDLIKNIINLKNLNKIPDPSKFNFGRSSLYVFIPAENTYKIWGKKDSITKCLIPIEGDKETIKCLFDTVYSISGDIVGNGELLAEHIFSNFELLNTYKERKVDNSNNKVDGKLLNSNVKIDVKHTIHFVEGIHNVDKHKNPRAEYTDDHGKKLLYNTLYLMFDFKSDQAKYALVYYNKK